MKIKKVGPIGAEVLDVELSKADDLPVDDIKKAFLEFSVLIFKNQKLSPNDLRQVALIWGKPLIHPIFKGIEGYPEIIQIQNLGEKYHTNAHWHSDVTFEEEPPDATLLYSLEIPDEGGDTLFADQYLAYEELPEVLKEELKETVAIHSNLGVLMLAGGDINNLSEVEHPVFRNHPETRKKSLFVTEAFVKELKEADPKYSEETLSRLYKHSSKNDYVYRHKWTKGDLVVWDNRCVLHYAEHGYGNKKRTMHRITTSGSKPF